MSGFTNLGEIADIEVGYAFKSREFSRDDSGVKLLRGDNIGQGTVKWNHTERWPSDRPVPSRYELQPADVVLAMDRPWVSAGLKFARIRDTDLPAYLVQRVARIRAKAGTVQKYLSAVLAGRNFTDYILSVQTGTSIPHISGRQIADFPLQPHTLIEQRAIAEVLGTLDDKIVTNRKLASTAEILAGAVYDQHTAGAPSRRMSDVLEPVLGGTPKRSRTDYWDGNQLWASAKDVTGAPFGVVSDTEERITSLATTETKAKPLMKGSVILTARGTVGAVARLARASSFNQSCYGFEPRNLPPGVLYHSILRATERAKSIAHGSVFDTITKNTFDHLSVPEMDAPLLDELESRIGPLLETVDMVVQQNSSLAATRDALLPLIMSGKLRVLEAEALIAVEV